MVVVRARRIGKTFTTGGETVHAVDDVSLDVPAGRMLVLIGASGSGKSTLLNLIGGLERPDSGALTVLGTDLRTATARETAQLRLTRIGFVFQDFNLVRDLTLAENVSLPLEGNGTARRPARAAARDALDRVGLAGLADRYPAEVSGGQQQRASIARAIVGERELVLADEPTGALDSRTGREIMDLLGGLRAEGVTVVLSTHNPANLGHGDQVLELADGRTVPAVDRTTGGTAERTDGEGCP
ncbi:ABC transporter ATP-binding protein [Kitasatospora sp. NPDC096147]|uniref:ABC transporter ATP-binding protein n=1 Tax=Kitasatospora sp. NPDC096147 TaxID=3364093 RepID=UPI0037FD0965